MRNIPRWVVPGAAVLLLGILLLLALDRFERRVETAEQTLREVLAMSKTDYLLLRGPDGRMHVFYPNTGEDRAAYYARARRAVTEGLGDENYICSVFDGCLPGGFSAELCTYCPNGRNPECQARHDNQKALFCAEFHCTQGCP